MLHVDMKFVMFVLVFLSAPVNNTGVRTCVKRRYSGMGEVYLNSEGVYYGWLDGIQPWNNNLSSN